MAREERGHKNARVENAHPGQRAENGDEGDEVGEHLLRAGRHVEVAVWAGGQPLAEGGEEGGERTRGRRRRSRERERCKELPSSWCA
jgi:hypothetical protein